MDERLRRAERAAALNDPDGIERARREACRAGDHVWPWEQENGPAQTACYRPARCVWCGQLEYAPPPMLCTIAAYHHPFASALPYAPSAAYPQLTLPGLQAYPDLAVEGGPTIILESGESLSS